MIVSTVISRELIIDLVPVIRIPNDPSSKLCLCVRYQHCPSKLNLVLPKTTHLACWWWISHPTYPVSTMGIKEIIYLSMIHLTEGLTKFNSLSDTICLTFLHLAMSLLRAQMKESVSRLWVTSMCTHCSTCSSIMLLNNGLNISTVQFVKGGDSWNLFFCRFYIISSPILLRHMIHLEMIDFQFHTFLTVCCIRMRPLHN